MQNCIFWVWVFQWLSERAFFFLEKNRDVIEIIRVDPKICDGMLHLSCFMGKINLFGLNLSGFLESFENICDVMEIRVEGVFFMIELRCIFWVFAQILLEK